MAKAEHMGDTGFKMGDPYFCTQCDRNHTKGKIYKDHIKYIESDTLESNEGDVEISDEEFLEEEVYDDEIEYIDDECDEELEEALQAALSKEECIKQVKALPGVGEATLNKLIKAGFGSLESIAYTPPGHIKEDSGLGDKTVAKLVKASMEKLDIGFKSGADVWEKRKNIARITTGAQELDDLLGGGVETGSLIEFFGEFRTGKTQIMHQLCVNVQKSREQGGLEGRALYIDYSDKLLELFGLIDPSDRQS